MAVRKFLIIMVAFTMLFCDTGFALANVNKQLDETFLSGATFTGQLSFSDSYDNLLAVSGVLTGNPYGPSPDPINWVWWGSSHPMGSGIYADFLINGTNGSDWTQFIEIDWRHTGEGNLVLDNSLGSVSSGDIANAINYSDPVVLYAFSDGDSNGYSFEVSCLVDTMVISFVPEPATILLLSLGLIGLISIRRKLLK